MSTTDSTPTDNNTPADDNTAADSTPTAATAGDTTPMATTPGDVTPRDDVPRHQSAEAGPVAHDVSVDSSRDPEPTPRPTPSQTATASRPATPPAPTGTAAVGTASATTTAARQPTSAPDEGPWLQGPAPFAIVLGLLGLLVAGAVLVGELVDVTFPWRDLGPWTVVAAGLVVVLVGVIGLRSSRRAHG